MTNICLHFPAHVLGVCGPSPVLPGWLILPQCASSMYHVLFGFGDLRALTNLSAGLHDTNFTATSKFPLALRV